MGWAVLFVTGLLVVSVNSINIKYGYTDSELAAFIANTVSNLGTTNYKSNSWNII